MGDAAGNAFPIEEVLSEIVFLVSSSKKSFLLVGLVVFPEKLFDAVPNILTAPGPRSIIFTLPQDAKNSNVKINKKLKCLTSNRERKPNQKMVF